MSSPLRREMELFDAACDAAPDQRRALLQRECPDNPVLVERVLRMVEKSVARGPIAGEDAPASSFARPGLRFGEFTLERRLDDAHSPGGFGEVWLALRDQPHQQVAIKILRPDMHWSEAIARFERERKILASLSHPHIAQFLGSGVSPHGWHYFVMQYVRGQPITSYCDAHRLDTRSRLGLLAAVAAAVQHAHAKGIVHRDLKPGNVLIEEHQGVPHPIVIDFGIAKAVDRPVADLLGRTLAASGIGSPEYMSPEQAGLRALDIDARTDVYGLGVLLYELLVGVTPFGFSSQAEVSLQAAYVRIDRDERPRASRRFDSLDHRRQTEIARARSTVPRALRKLLRDELEWIPAKAMELERDLRYATAHEFGRDLDNYLTHRPLIAGPGTPWYETQKFLRKHRGPVTAVGVIAVMLALGIGGTSYGLWKSQRSLIVAEESLRFLENALENTSPNRSGPETRLIDVFREGEDRIDSEFVDRPEVRWRLHRTYARVYRGLSLPAEALAHVEQALQTSTGVLSPSSRERRDLELLRGRTLGDMCDFRGDAASAMTSGNWGPLLHDLGDYDGAEYFLRLAMEALSGDPSSTETIRAEVLDNRREDLTWLLLDVGRLDEAGDLAEQTLRSRRERSAQSQEVASSLRTLGYVWLAQGRADEARTFLEESAKIFARLQGKAGTPIENLSRLMLSSIDEDQALFSTRNVHSLSRTVSQDLGPMRCFEPIWVRNRARLASRRGEGARADSLFAHSITISAVYESGDAWRPIEAHTRLSWGQALHAEGRLADAEANLRLARDAASEAPEGVAQGAMAAIDLALARVLREAERTREAVVLLAGAVRLRRATLPKSAWPIAHCGFELALTRTMLDNTDAARNDLRSALEELEAALGGEAGGQASVHTPRSNVHPLLARARDECEKYLKGSIKP